MTREGDSFGKVKLQTWKAFPRLLSELWHLSCRQDPYLVAVMWISQAAIKRPEVQALRGIRTVRVPVLPTINDGARLDGTPAIPEFCA